MNDRHRHRSRPSLQEERGFGNCVARAGYCEPASHGCITLTDFCRCGWERLTNINGFHFVEVGPWLAPSSGRCRHCGHTLTEEIHDVDRPRTTRTGIGSIEARQRHYHSR